jgi:hypothetical protein
MELWKLEVVDRDSAVRFIRRCVKEIGPGFHPDTLASDYILVETGRPLFDNSASAMMETLLKRAFRFCDPYQVALGAARRALKRRIPT